MENAPNPILRLLPVSVRIELFVMRSQPTAASFPILTLAALVLLGSSASVVGAGNQWSRLYDVRFSDPDVELEGKAAVIGEAAARHLWLGVGVRRKGRMSGRQKLRLWRLNDNARVELETSISHDLAAAGIGEAQMDMADIVPLSDGGVAVVLVSDSGVSKLAVYSEKGGLRRLISVGDDESTTWIKKAVATPDGNLLLVGRGARGGSIYEIGADGTAIAHFTVELSDGPGIGLLSDILVEPNGALLLLGHENRALGDLRLWLGRLKGGRFITVDTVKGFQGSIAGGVGRRFVVASDTWGLRKREYWLRAYMDTARVWARRVHVSDQVIGVSVPKAIMLDSGGSVVAAPRDGILLISKWDPDGALVSDILLDADPSAQSVLWDFLLVNDGKRVIVPMTVLEMDPEAKWQRQRIRLVSYSVD